ncbi:uncharacterized protein LOC6563242 [Drosophila grimshawi]|uniref:GH19432 n=1 Tax=Drosophila grimshawi TaxID=7222 RepID=B4JG83_DROGR|nr:uncharacterized protein LOC6563242 [Drosophila grimshawi]EDV93650.1 GH19432 [Drosophila grimshawi]
MLSPTEVQSFKYLQIVAFHYFDSHFKELNKWISLLDKLALEYADRITFKTQDITTISTFHESLSIDDFGSFRADVPPRLYGIDKDNHIYTMQMFFNYKYLKDFSELLIQGKMFQALVLEPSPELDLPPQNMYYLKDKYSKDYFIMFYDPACYYWTLQLGKLRKLSKLLANEDVIVIIVNKAHNYLGIDVERWSKLNSFEGTITFATNRPDGWSSKYQGRLDSTRNYLHYIAQGRNPELRDYDGLGEPRVPENTLCDIRYLFKSSTEQI